MPRIKGQSAGYPGSIGSPAGRGPRGGTINDPTRSSRLDDDRGLIRFGTDPLRLSYGDRSAVGRHPHYSHYPYYGHRGHYYGYRPHYYPRSCYPYYGFYPSYGYSYGLGFGLGYTYSTVYASDPYVGYVYTAPEYVPSYATYTEGDVAVPVTEAAQPTQPQAAQPAPPDQYREGDREYQTLDTGVDQRAVVMEGNAAFAAGRYDEARDQYIRAVMNDERDGYAKVLYAWSNFALGDYEVAAVSIRRAMITTPDLADYPLDLRTLYPDRTVLDRQTEALVRFLADHPDRDDARLVWGYLLYSIGQAETAAAAFQGLAGAHPDDELLSQLRDAALRNARNESPQPVAP